MRAVLTLAVFVVGDLQTLVDVIEAEGDLEIPVQVGGLQAADPLGRIQDRIPIGIGFGQNLGHLCLVHHIQGRQIVFIRLSCLLRVLLEGMGQSVGIHGLMIRIQAGVDDRNPTASAGVARLPGQVGAGHPGGNGHVGPVSRIGHRLLGLIPGLQNHLLDARDLGNGRNLAIFHVGGNQVGSQGQVPDHIQLLAGGLLNLGRHIGLRFPQACAIGHRRPIVGNAGGGVASFQGGRLLQKNGNADQIGGRITGFACCVFHGLSEERCGNRAVVYLRKADLGLAAARCAHRHSKGEQHRKGQEVRK
ncbi:unknown [Firmicutes bacterium CAG:137]|nr:unknown [Firmicutes bacterium CAG:137]